MTYTDDWVLTWDEFETLTPREQARYLRLLAKAAREWVLHPKQAEADAMADRCDHTLFGGSAGPGKSNWLLNRAQRLSRAHSGHATLALRRTFPQLRKTLMRKSIEEFARIPEAERPTWRAADKEWRFPNGSIIEFGHCQYDENVGDYLSAEYDLIIFDEQTQFTQHQYRLISSRARTTGVKVRGGVRPHVIGATNPGEIGHHWNKEQFIDPTDYGRAGDGSYVVELEDARTGESFERRFGYVHATVMDNPHMPKDYIANLLAQGEVEKQRYLYGNWDYIEGAFFDEFDRELHIVWDNEATEQSPSFLEQFPSGQIPLEWPRRTAVDYGSYAPWCCLWGAWDHDGTLWIYREGYRSGLTPPEQAKWMLDAENGDGRVEMRVGDPSMWAQTHKTGGVGMNISDQYAAEGIHMLKAMNDRVAGWARVKDYLRRDGTGRPGIRILGDRCPNLVRTLPTQQRDEKKPEDIDTEGEDHAADALRYLCMTRDRTWHKPPATGWDRTLRDPRTDPNRRSRLTR